MGAWWSTEIGARGTLRRFIWGVVLSALLVLWAYLWGDPEAQPEWAWLQYLPWPLLLPPLGLLGLSMWPLAGRWRWMAWLPLCVLAGPIMGWSWGTPDAGQQRLRFMSYNAKVQQLDIRPQGHQELAREMERNDADVVVLQDARFFMDIALNHADALARIIGGREQHILGQYVLLSRYPILGCSKGPANAPPESFYFLQCALSVQGQTLHVLVAHLWSPRGGLNALRALLDRGQPAWGINVQLRLKEAQALADAVRACPAPCILAGDFNAPERSQVFNWLLQPGWRHAWSSSTWGWGYTHGHTLVKGLSFSRIDHILLTDDIGVADIWVGGQKASDHRPVVADLYLQRQR